MTTRDELRLLLEREFTRLIQDLEDKIDQTNLDLLNDFVQNYEYGVALDWLQSLIAERPISLTERQETAIQQLKRRMGLPLDEN